MGRGALRGALTAWLGLTALYAVGSSKAATGRLAELAAGITNTIDRLLDPNIPAIPDLRAGESWGGGGAPVGTFGTPGDRPTGRPVGPFVQPQR